MQKMEALIVPLWNWKTDGEQAEIAELGLNCTFMELKGARRQSF